MRPLFAIFIVLLILAHPADAEQYLSEQYRVSLTLPPGETWVRGNPIVLPAGEMLFIASHPPTKQNAAVIIIPRIPSNDLENPAVVNRIVEAVMTLGFSVTSTAPVTIGNTTFLQILGRRSDSAAVTSICVARAAVRNHTIHLALTTGQGAEERAVDKGFLRVLDTFTLLDDAISTRPAASGHLTMYYRTAYQTAFIAIGSLLFIGLLVLLFSRQHAR